MFVTNNKIVKNLNLDKIAIRLVEFNRVRETDELVRFLMEKAQIF